MITHVWKCKQILISNSDVGYVFKLFNRSCFVPFLNKRYFIWGAYFKSVFPKLAPRDSHIVWWLYYWTCTEHGNYNTVFSLFPKVKIIWLPVAWNCLLNWMIYTNQQFELFFKPIERIVIIACVRKWQYLQISSSRGAALLTWWCAVAAVTWQYERHFKFVNKKQTVPQTLAWRKWSDMTVIVIILAHLIPNMLKWEFSANIQQWHNMTRAEFSEYILLLSKFWKKCIHFYIL